MFTGIVEGVGIIRRIRKTRRMTSLTLQAPFSLAGLRPGESLAVNGCCLTVISREGRRVAFDLSPETLKVTNLGRIGPGDGVNLERPLRVGDRFGGHLVQGHVDGVGRIGRVKRNGRCLEIVVAYPPHIKPLLIPKGSIAVDGVSMTVNRLTPRTFTLMVVPHTLKKTILSTYRPGTPVNLEADLVAKYLRHGRGPLTPRSLLGDLRSRRSTRRRHVRCR